MNKDMYLLGSQGSEIRRLHAIGEELKRDGKEVFDFTIGNPSAPVPSATRLSLLRLIDEDNIHAYSGESGDFGVRQAIAEDISRRFGVPTSADFIYMTCGAAAALTIVLKAIVNSGDEVILISPYFPEYKVYVESVGAKAVVVPANEDFGLDIPAISAAITQRTQAIIINSPNNPSGAVYDEASLMALAKLLDSLDHTVYLISDEPYREIAYVTVPYPAKYYVNTVTCYSFSKSMSLPGERIGYIALRSDIPDGALFPAIVGAGRALGYICAPTLFQHAVAECITALPDLSVYLKNRDLLVEALIDIGYSISRPDGAFYVFMKALEPDAVAFAKRAADMGLLLVPSDDFGMTGYVRIAYCVPYETIKNSIPIFKKLYTGYHFDKN